MLRIARQLKLTNVFSRRFLATTTELPGDVVTSSATSGSAENAPSTSSNSGALRPHLNVPTSPNHGLYGFFRRDEDGKYVLAEQKHYVKDRSGRAWTAVELRRKSFKDLHTLWYVVLRERNLLATQMHEITRLGATRLTTSATRKDFRCKKTMARIKQVLNERRLAYAAAVEITAQQQATPPQELYQEVKIDRTIGTLFEEGGDKGVRDGARA